MVYTSANKVAEAALEAALKVRLDFIVFADFELGTATPDETTINRLRNRLVPAKLDSVLLAEINRQLQQHDLIVQGAYATLVDATIVTSAARLQQSLEILHRKDEAAPEAQVTDRKNPDARWLKKSSKSHFDYRGYVAADERTTAREPRNCPPSLQGGTGLWHAEAAFPFDMSTMILWRSQGEDVNGAHRHEVELAQSPTEAGKWPCTLCSMRKISAKIPAIARKNSKMLAYETNC